MSISDVSSIGTDIILYLLNNYYYIAARFACDMLGCSFELLEQCITKRIVETSRDVVITPLSALEVRVYETE